MRRSPIKNTTEQKNNKTVVLPFTGWTEERPWNKDFANGFSASVYKKGNDIVIAYAGTRVKGIRCE